MSDLAYTAVLCGVCFLIGGLSVLSGACDWDWWMRSLGRLAVRRYGRGRARLHFVGCGLLILGLGAYSTWDALAAGERLRPVRSHAASPVQS